MRTDFFTSGAWVVLLVIIVYTVTVLGIVVLAMGNTYDNDIGTMTINDLEINYDGSVCDDGLLVLRHAYITGHGIGVSVRNWVSLVPCEE